jgi:hypothetical protein
MTSQIHSLLGNMLYELRRHRKRTGIGGRGLSRMRQISREGK